MALLMMESRRSSLIENSGFLEREEFSSSWNLVCLDFPSVFVTRNVESSGSSGIGVSTTKASGSSELDDDDEVIGVLNIFRDILICSR